MLEFPEQFGGEIAITEPRTVIGRHSDANIRVNDIRVSRHHALLVLDEGGQFESTIRWPTGPSRTRS